MNRARKRHWDCFLLQAASTAHRGNIDNVYDARIADGDIKVPNRGLRKITSGAPLRVTSPITRPDSASIATRCPHRK
jgi:hypothetical protein